MENDGARRGFTLTELLITIAIIAILFVVLVVTINPPQLLAQSRDAKRVSDLSAVNGAITLYQEQQRGLSGYSLGSLTTVYLSTPDPAATSTAGDACTGLGVPSSTGYAYHCAASTTYVNASTTGWLPVNFQNIGGGSPLATVPVDPKNQTSSNLYYTYETNGTQWALSAFLESQKYAKNMEATGGVDPALYEVGTGIASLPEAGRGLVGYWPLNEGGGATAALDYSGSNSTGTWNGTTTNGSYYTTNAHVGSNAGNFNGTNDYVVATFSSGATFPATNPSFTISQWINIPSSANGSWMMVVSGSQLGRFVACGAANSIEMSYKNAAQTPYTTGCIYNIPTSTWNMFTATYDGTTGKLYENGTLVSSVANGGVLPSGGTASVYLGSAGVGYQNVNILTNDDRVYNVALSAAEIQQIYNAEK